MVLKYVMCLILFLQFHNGASLQMQSFGEGNNKTKTIKDTSPPPMIKDEVYSLTNISSITQTMPKTFHFVLVHSYTGGGWTWYKIRYLLEKSGHKVSSPDLKSGGIDPTEPDSLRSFDEYNKPLIDLLSSLPENEKVILVGHSAGGISVTDASHKFCDKIHAAVYVAATMLRLGFWNDEDFRDGIPEQYHKIIGLVGEEEDARKTKMSVDMMQNTITAGEFKSNLKYHAFPPQDAVLRKSLSKKGGPMKAVRSARFKGRTCVNKVKRVYIRTLHDQVLKPWQQHAMLKRWRPSKVFSVNSDHMVPFSAPRILFRLIIKAANLNI